MDEVLRKQIYNKLILKETEDLKEIWQQKNLDEYEEEVFEIIQEILLQRLGYVPQHSVQVQINEILLRVENYLDVGELDQALCECETVIESAPDLADAFYYRRLIYDEMVQLEKAIANYREAIRLDPELQDAWDALNSVEKDIEEEFQQSPTKQHLDQALAYAYDDNPEKAVEECELAMQSIPGIASAHNYLGMIYEVMEKFELAIDAYLKAIQLNPRFYAARENLANARIKLEEEQYRRIALEDAYGTQEEMDGWSGEDKDTVSQLDGNIDEELLDDLEPIPGWVYIDEKSYLLTGWPGHRTRPGRSGYDPLDTDFETAHMQGRIIRLLFTRKFRTRNPVYLLVMVWVGLLLCSPLSCAGTIFLQGNWASIGFILVTSPYWVVGIAVFVNVCLSLFVMDDEFDETGSAFF